MEKLNKMTITVENIPGDDFAGMLRDVEGIIRSNTGKGVVYSPNMVIDFGLLHLSMMKYLTMMQASAYTLYAFQEVERMKKNKGNAT